jgi:hypothetical protein
MPILDSLAKQSGLRGVLLATGLGGVFGGLSALGIHAHRILWRELLDLELQDIDEQVSRICRAAGGAPTSGQEGNWRDATSKEMGVL